jgi:transposase-like protein
LVSKLAKTIELGIPRKIRNFIAMDETCFKSNGERVFIYFAVDAEERICLD